MPPCTGCDQPRPDWCWRPDITILVLALEPQSLICPEADQVPDVIKETAGSRRLLVGFGPLRSEFHVLDGLHYVGPGIHHERLTRTGPYLLHGCEQSLGICDRVKVQVYGDVVGVVDRLRDSVATDSGTLAIGRIAVERLLPKVEIRHCMLNTKRGHLGGPPLVPVVSHATSKKSEETVPDRRLITDAGSVFEPWCSLRQVEDVLLCTSSKNS